MTAIEQRLSRPIDGASLAVFRIGFGVLMLVLVARFFVHDWINEYFGVPKHFFSYWGFGWVKPWPGAGMQVHFALMGLTALGIALGYWYRFSVLSFGLLFAYAHLIDQTHYLNHYYLVIWLCSAMTLLPLHGLWSLDARRGAYLATHVPAWVLWTLRAQFGLVYLFGGIAKLKADWLLRAEPLSTWLAANPDFPLIGPLLDERWLAFVMSWAGALFDLSIVPFLLWKPSRRFAYVAVLAFHLTTAQLFQLGMFPYLMMFGSLLFLPPDWPRTVFGLLRPAESPPPPATAPRAGSRPLLSLLAAAFLSQLAFPLRHLLYPGPVCWTEQGYRFAWNVMLMEKNGSVDFRVVEPRTGHTFNVSPRAYFTPYQVKMMAPQPDMLLQAAHIVAADFRRRGAVEPQVYADAFVSLNGRPMQRLLDPRVDLARESDSLRHKTWILPLLAEPPTAHAARLGSLK